MNIVLIVEYQDKFFEFQSNIEKTVRYQIEFWRELLETNPDNNKLLSLGTIITKKIEDIDIQFKVIMKMGFNSVKFLLLYGNFLRDIVNDDAENRRV